MELKIRTSIGIMTAMFEGYDINCWQTIYTAWFKEKPSCIVEASSINAAIDELHKSLEVLLEFEK